MGVQEFGWDKVGINEQNIVLFFCGRINESKNCVYEEIH